MPDTHGSNRTVDEIKREIRRRTEQRINPFGHVLPEDVERALNSLQSLDGDHWAEVWSEVGLNYESKGDALAAANDSPHDASEAYYHGFDYCRIGRYPCCSTPGKVRSYGHSVRIFRKAAKYFDPPLEIVELPFKDKKMVGYLQVPSGTAKPAVAFHWGGVDGWKEDRRGQNAMLHERGIATLVVDMPGTGENPVLYSDPDAESTYSTWIDYLCRRQDVDGNRIAVWGGSFGGYWAARLAYTEASRLKAAVFHGGNAHYGFQETWLRNAFTKGASTYLFGPASLLEARSRAMGVKTMDEFLDLAPRFSLRDMGLLDRPSAPLLGINGKLDDQAPVDDIYLLMEHGSPKCARIYPQGSHMGRTPGTHEDEITRTITDWIRDQLSRWI